MRKIFSFLLISFLITSLIGCAAKPVVPVVAPPVKISTVTTSIKDKLALKEKLAEEEKLAQENSLSLITFLKDSLSRVFFYTFKQSISFNNCTRIFFFHYTKFTFFTFKLMPTQKQLFRI